MKLEIRKLIYTGKTAGQEVNTNGAYGSWWGSNVVSSENAAWAGRFDVGVGAGNDAYKIDLGYWTGPDRWGAQIQGISNDSWVEVTDITAPAGSLSKTSKFYIKFTTYPGQVGAYFDFLGMGTTVDGVFGTTPIDSTVITANSYRTGDVVKTNANNWSRPSSWESKRLVYSPGYVWAEIDWTFTRDANLGSTQFFAA